MTAVKSDFPPAKWLTSKVVVLFFPVIQLFCIRDRTIDLSDFEGLSSVSSVTARKEKASELGYQPFFVAYVKAGQSIHSRSV